jgi:hypothetical protein
MVRSESEDKELFPPWRAWFAGGTEFANYHSFGFRIVAIRFPASSAMKARDLLRRRCSRNLMKWKIHESSQGAHPALSGNCANGKPAIS